MSSNDETKPDDFETHYSDADHDEVGGTLSRATAAHASLPRLTRRSVGLLIAAGAIGLIAAVFRQVDMARVAVFLAALPASSWLFVLFTTSTLHVARTADPVVVQHGGHIEVTVHYRLSRFSPALVAYDDVPPQLGEAPAFVMSATRGGAGVVRYALRGNHRGVWQLGSVHASCLDPLSLAVRRYIATPSGGVTVLPAVHDVTADVPHGGGHRGAHGLSPDAGSNGAPDTSVRGYRHGDDIRRVHWRTTARRGELMVRNTSRKEDNVLVLAVNTSADAHDDAGASFEWTISAAASLMIDLVDQGWEVHLVESGRVTVVDASDPASTSAGLVHLAQVQMTRTNALQDMIYAVSGSGRAKSAVVLPGVVSDSDAALLAHLAKEFPTGVLMPFVPAEDSTLAAQMSDLSGAHIAQAAQHLQSVVSTNGWAFRPVDPTVEDVPVAMSGSPTTRPAASPHQQTEAGDR